MNKLKSFSIIFLTFCVAGCIKQPPAVDGQAFRQLTSLGKQAVFSATSDGHLVAYANHGLKLLDVMTSDKLSLSSENPFRLAWSPDNRSLAAVFPVADYESRLVQYAADGQVLHQEKLPVAVNGIYWSARGDLLVTGYRLNVYSFGGNLQQSLYYSDGHDFVEVLLTDTTLRPRTVQAVSNALPKVLPVLFTPYGDELFYVRFHDPPEFSPYLAVVSRNWQVEEEKELLKLSLQAITMWSGSHDDAAVVITGTEKIDVESWPEVETDRSSRAWYRFADGELFANDSLAADWGKGAVMQFLSGGRFMLAFKDNLFLGTGLQERQERHYAEGTWLLRRWRAAGLITQEDYSQQVSRGR